MRKLSAIFRSGAKFYTEGEAPTKYFLNMEKNRSAVKGMTCLVKPSGQTTHNTAEILKAQYKFYKKLYTSNESTKFEYTNQSGIFLNEELRNKMEGEIQMHELTAALKSSKRNVSPGCDRLTTEFYMVFWNDVKNTLLEAINYSYKKGVLFPSALRGVVTLIPKKDKDTRILSNLRPISILPTDYKLIEKTLANRLRPALDYIVNEDQKGFMSSRRISCNIRRILDLIKIADVDDLEAVIISIDFQKCFDMVEINGLVGAMEYFQFGDSFIQWTKLLYNNSIACVSNNGYFSEYYNVTRSVKQGGPCSAFYFLILAEVLAIELRKNPKLKGIVVNLIEKILGQYADDMDLYLLGKTDVITEAFNIITKFKNSSGFKINYNKTTIYRIGSLRYSKAILYTQHSVQWPTASINVLGVDVCCDENRLIDLNYKPLVNKAQNILNSWYNRSKGLSIIGKVLIVNTLVASLFVYKMTVLPAIPSHYVKMLDDMVQSFLWNNKKPKIPLSVLQQHKYKGGLGLVNFQRKDAALKCSWAFVIESDSLLMQIMFKMLCPIICMDIWKCNINSYDVKILFYKGFWSDTLAAWSEFNYKEQIKNGDEVYAQFIWYNSHLRVNKRPFLFKKAYKEGLTHVAQLFDTNGKIIECEICCRMFMLTTLQYNQLISAIPKSWKGMVSHDSSFVENNNYDDYKKRTKCVAKIYEALSQNADIIKIKQRWNTKVEMSLTHESFIALYKKIYSITNNAKLRSFQYRMLNCAIILNDTLYKWKIKSSPNCAYCERKETMLHFFWECNNAQKIWAWTSKYCKKLAPQQSIEIDKDNVFMNLVNSKPKHAFNFCVLVVKQTMYAFRCLQKNITTYDLESKIERYKRYELYQARKTNTMYSYNEKWFTDISIEKEILSE